MHIEWNVLEKQLDKRHHKEDADSLMLAQEALAKILGKKTIQQTVNLCLSGHPGAELARNVLGYLQPREAMEYCFERIQKDNCEDIRQSAAELLRLVSDETVLPWLPRLLKDKNDVVAFCVTGILEQLLHSDIIRYEDAEPIISLATQHPSCAVRQAASLCKGHYSLDRTIEALADEPEKSPVIHFSLIDETKHLNHGDKLAIRYQDENSALFIILDHVQNVWKAINDSGEPCGFKKINMTKYVFA